MTTIPQTWTGKATEALARLGSSPWMLFLCLWTVNGLARPYTGFIHDARLYAVQVLNQMDSGAFADDLFLRYGSQDQFSLFSRCVAPLANLLGLEAAFFILYLVFNGLLLVGMIRLVRALIPDRRISTLALLYLAVSPLPFGGLNVFNIQETFLTPRILANALTLMALERTLRGRFLQAVPLLAGAMAMHPLMAIGGLLIWGGCLAREHLPNLAFAGLLVSVTIAGVGVLAIPALGVAFFGTMDEDWRDMVRRVSSYNFVDEWTWRDWLHVIVSLTLVIFSSRQWRQSNPRRGRFLEIVALAGAAGLAGTAVCSYLPYALLFQVQPYRILWIVRVCEIPLGFWWIAHWLKEGRQGGWAIALAAYFSFIAFMPVEIGFPLFFWPVFILAYRGLEAQPRRSDWLVVSGLVSLLWGAVSWAIYKWYVIWVHWDTLVHQIDLLDHARLIVDHIGPAGWLLITVYALIRWQPLNRKILLAAPALALFVNLVYFGLPQLSLYRQHCTRDYGDIDFVRAVLRERGTGPKPATVYCSLGRADFVWVDLRAKSFYDWAQVVGVIFNRQTAVEGSRRAALVSLFELDRFRNDPFFGEESRDLIERLYQTSWSAPDPTSEELYRLCREEIDFVVLKRDFPGLSVAGNGRVFIYDCRALQRQASTQFAPPASNPLK